MTIHFVPRMMRAAALVGGSGVLVAGVMLAVAGPAQAQVTCGSTVTASITLTQNIDCTSDTTGDALTIGAPGVTVNLNGHSILGPGYTANTYAIIDDNPGYGSVTIENGTISNFYAGFVIEGTSTGLLTGVVVQNLTTTSNAPQEGYAVYGEYLSGAVVHNVSAKNVYDAIELDYSQDSTVTGNHVTSPVYGLYDYRGTGNTWSSNTATGVIDDGLYVDEATNPVIRSNAFSGPSGDGIDLYDTTGATIAVNNLSNVYDGVYDEVGTNNTIKYNKGSHDPWGIYSYEVTGAIYAGNTFGSGNYGIETDYPYSETLTGNTTNSNSEAGIYLYDSNESGYTASLSYNTANYNQFGLYSQFPTTGKGNKATGNKAINCFNVTCVHTAAAPAVTAAPPHTPPKAPARPAPLVRP